MFVYPSTPIYTPKRNTPNPIPKPNHHWGIQTRLYENA